VVHAVARSWPNGWCCVGHLLVHMRGAVELRASSPMKQCQSMVLLGLHAHKTKQGPGPRSVSEDSGRRHHTTSPIHHSVVGSQSHLLTCCASPVHGAPLLQKRGHRPSAPSIEGMQGELAAVLTARVMEHEPVAAVGSAEVMQVAAARTEKSALLPAQDSPETQVSAETGAVAESALCTAW
jgi:hypothetical protein